MMKKRCDIVEWVVCMLFMTTCFSACCSIDDDLSDCGEPEKDLKLEYQLRLVTNMTTELETQLTTITETRVAGALRTHLENIFSDHAHDIDLNFYDTEGALNSLYHKSDIIDASQTSYTLTLPMRKYMHLAVANIADNNVVDLKDEQHSNTSMLLQEEGNVSDGFPVRIVDSHTTGLFTARQSMEVLSDVSQTFNVRLFMANSAVALVLNPKGHQYTDMKVYGTGFAHQFNIKDSVYIYPTESPLIKANKVETGNDYLCYCSVNFPSRDVRTRADEETLWQIKVYLTNADGKVTESVLDIKEALKAGNLKILKGELDDDGAIRPYDSRIGVSVMLDWNEGGSYDPDL